MFLLKSCDLYFLIEKLQWKHTFSIKFFKLYSVWCHNPIVKHTLNSSLGIYIFTFWYFDTSSKKHSRNCTNFLVYISKTMSSHYDLWFYSKMNDKLCRTEGYSLCNGLWASIDPLYFSVDRPTLILLSRISWSISRPFMSNCSNAW